MRVMSQAAVQLKVAGQVYRVVTSAPEEELSRLVASVEDALAQVTPPGRQPSQQALVLAALTLAHELEEEREKVRQLQIQQRNLLEGILGRIDRALGEAEPAAVLAGSSSRARSDNRSR